MTNTRDKLYKRFTKQVITQAARTGSGTEIEPISESHTERKGSAAAKADGYSVDLTHMPPTEELGPAKKIISRMPNKSQRRLKKAAQAIDNTIIFISRLGFTIYELRPWREKSVQELEKEAEVKARDKMRRILRKEAAEFARRASNAYHRMGLSHTPPLHRRSLLNGVKKVRFSNIVAERNAIWMQIDTNKLPYGVNILSLVEDKNILTNVSSSLRHHIQGAYDVERGAWLCIERGRGVRGIPQDVAYKKMMLLKNKAADGLTIPLGETVNSKRIYRTLKDFPHLLVGGATGRGKTSYLNVILCAIIENNEPEDVRIVLVDLKGGIEFDMYKGVPHLWNMGGKEDVPEDNQIAPDGIVGRSDKVLKLLDRLKYEGERRLKMFKSAKVTNIDEYNKRRIKSKLHRVVIVFDEWARVSLGPDGKKADNLLSEITATYRAVGFHVILATQTPTVKVISTLIKTNFNARLAFGVPDNTGSIVILDNGRAKDLSPVGRAIFKYGITVVETQVPWLKPNELKAILAKARAGDKAVDNNISMLEIARFSLENLEGSLSVKRVYPQFQDKISWHVLNEKLKALDNALIDVDGVEYMIKPGRSNQPRQLIEYKPDGMLDPLE